MNSGDCYQLPIKAVWFGYFFPFSLNCNDVGLSLLENPGITEYLCYLSHKIIYMNEGFFNRNFYEKL